MTVKKSTVDEIRARFDADVERFSNLETGQAVTIDSPLHMELLTEAAAAVTPQARSVLDIGCGAGNYTLKLLQRLPTLEVTLIDLSRPMLDRAVERIRQAAGREARAIQGDVREVDLGVERFDIVMAAQCLHHLRDEAEWRDVFARVYACLRPGGSFWISDSVEHELPAVQQMVWRRWGEHLVDLKDAAYRDHVMAYVEKEDTPRPLTFQLDLLRQVGFARVDVLHKHNRFASFGGAKSSA
ncbi:MAG TPA: class I SAM-dependent methyltransferase [Phycisphaeraceae bacterium]